MIKPPTNYMYETELDQYGVDVVKMEDGEPVFKKWAGRVANILPEHNSTWQGGFCRRLVVSISEDTHSGNMATKNRRGSSGICLSLFQGRDTEGCPLDALPYIGYESYSSDD